MSTPRGQLPIDPALRRRNRRVALLLGGLVLFFFVTSFPFWQGVFQVFRGGAG